MSAKGGKKETGGAQVKALKKFVHEIPGNGFSPDGKLVGEYDPAPVVQRLDVYSLNGRDRYFSVRHGPGVFLSAGTWGNRRGDEEEEAKRYPGHDATHDGPLPPTGVLSWSEGDLKRALRLAGVHSSSKDSPQTIGKPYSQADLAIDYIQNFRSVEYAGPLAGHKIGLYNVQNRRILVTSSYTLIDPVEGEWPILATLLSNLLGDQLKWLFAWLKVGIESLRKGKPRPGHALILAGPSNCGKSLLQEYILTPCLGGRSADPTKYLLGKTNFNSEIGGAEHLCMQELPSGLDFKSRVLLGDELKRLIATESQSLHPKYCDAMTLYPWWRVSLSLNDNVDRIKALPALTSDFGDKILLLLCESKPMPMPTDTPEEREAFRAAIAAELPALVHFLLAWEIPAEMKQTKHASRFGHDFFHSPQLACALFENEPAAALLYILDNSPDLYLDGVWGWEPAEALREKLCDDATAGRFAAQARKLFGFPGAAGTFLSKLSEKFPERFQRKHHNKGNLWMVLAPGK